jgi:actin-related protein
MQHVFLTGGNSLIPGFDTRVEKELRMMNSANMTINVVNALNARLDAWRGGAMFAN